MNCNEARESLENLVNVKDIRLSSSDLTELVSLELVAPVDSGRASLSNDKMDSLRQRWRRRGL
jgi:hypothetical protein